MNSVCGIFFGIHALHLCIIDITLISLLVARASRCLATRLIIGQQMPMGVAVFLMGPSSKYESMKEVRNEEELNTF